MGWNYGDILDRVMEVVPADKPCLIHGERVISWADFTRRTNNLAAQLASRGIAAGDKVAFYITPSVGVGFAYIDDDRPPASNATTPVTELEGKGLTVQVALEARLVINNRGLIFLRPVSVDIISAEYTLSNNTTQWNTRVRWDLLFGGGVTF